MTWAVIVFSTPWAKVILLVANHGLVFLGFFRGFGGGEWIRALAGRRRKPWDYGGERRVVEMGGVQGKDE